MGRLSNPLDALESSAEQGLYRVMPTVKEATSTRFATSNDAQPSNSDNPGRLSNPVQRRLTRIEIERLLQSYVNDDDSGNSPLSITEIPHLRGAVGCC
jgi:hypothetical protein